jgi:hypothetical protein
MALPGSLWMTSSPRASASAGVGLQPPTVDYLAGRVAAPAGSPAHHHRRHYCPGRCHHNRCCNRCHCAIMVAIAIIAAIMIATAAAVDLHPPGRVIIL